MAQDDTLRIYSWNVNGIRACEKKGFRKWLDKSGAFVAGLQEVRARPEQLPLRIRKPRNWEHHMVCAEKKGYSGVSAYSKAVPDEIVVGLDVPEFDCEGRVHFVRFGQLVIANIYFPNGNGKERDNSRVPYKLAFYRRVLERLEEERSKGYRVLVMGDFNTAHHAIDLARPKTNTKTSGFLAEEREEMDRWVDAGWIDTFRLFHKDGEHYSWWAQRGGCRERNVGWRIDYVLASPEAAAFVTDASIHPKVMGSDHCPVSVDVQRAILTE